MSADQRRLDRSHKATEEGESTRVSPVSTAYSPVVRRSGPTEEDGQPLPTVAHAERRGLPTRVNGAALTACSAHRCGELVPESATGVPVLLVFGRPRPTRLETRTKECNMCASPLAQQTRRRNESEGTVAVLRESRPRGGTSPTDPIRTPVVRRDSSKSVSVATRKMVNYA